MVSLIILFLLFVALFSIIGALRGFAKEVLVLFSAILALFVLELVGQISVIKNLWTDKPMNLFYIPFIVTAILAVFGYHIPRVRFLRDEPKLARDNWLRSVMGAFFGILNGYFIVGSIWAYWDKAMNAFPEDTFAPLFIHITRNCPDPKPAIELLELAVTTCKWINYLPPNLPWTELSLGIAVAGAFIIVLRVFI